jgi:hypothetical protein
MLFQTRASMENRGVVKTIILYHECRNELEMLVINEPGHGHAEIIALGEEASGAVFAQETASRPSPVGKEVRLVG